MKAPAIPVVVAVKVIPPYGLDVSFVDGSQRTVDLKALLFGPVFEPLVDPHRFAEVTVDSETGTVVWPNGADLSPEFLYIAEASPPVEG